MKCSRSIAKLKLSTCPFRLFSAKTDSELFESFGWVPRIKCIGSVLSREGLAPFRQQVKTGISFTIIDAMILRSSLENPLLKKYEFNMEDFIQGAKTAVENICETVQSQEFHDYCLGNNNESQEIYSYLTENCDPSVISEIKASLIKRHQNKTSNMDIFNTNPGLYIKKIRNFGILLLATFKVGYYVNINKDDSNMSTSLKWKRDNFPPGSLRAFVGCHFTYDRIDIMNDKIGKEFLLFVNFEALISEDISGGLGPWKLTFLSSQ